MKKPSAPRPINLPYASTVASFYGDQGATQGNSFLGRMFRGGQGGSVVMQGQGGAGGGANLGGLASKMLFPALNVKTQAQPKAPAGGMAGMLARGIK